jgi:hypothetical protein
MLTSVGFFSTGFDGQFEHAPQAPLRRFTDHCHARHTRKAAAARTIMIARVSCISN